MKIILLFTLLFTSILANQTQIVLGTYSKYESAKNTQSKLNKIIEKDINLKNIFKKNNLKITIKKSDKYFIVSINPFNDITAQNKILAKLKTTRFKDAYILPLDSNQKSINKQISETKKNTIKNTSPITKSELSNENFLNKYFKEIIALILILTLSVIFLLARKKENKKNKTDVDIDILTNEKKHLDSEKNDTTKNDTTKNDINKNKKLKHFTNKKKDDFKDFKDCRIMVAEDNIINQKVVNGLLSSSGIQIVMVNDGLEAVNFLKEDDDFCIILMDVHMPNLNGYEATKIIRQNKKYNHITIVALSGDIAPDDVKKMKNVGMQEHLEKPLKIDSFYSILATYSFKRRNIIGLDKNTDTHNNRELNTEKGIELCGGDEEFYKEILNDFINDYSDSVIKIQNLLNNKSFTEIDKLLLDISGIVANIGAANIKNIVKDFKLSIKTPEDEKHILMFKKYAKHFEALKNEIKDYLKPL